jgi:hypothetical protein
LPARDSDVFVLPIDLDRFDESVEAFPFGLLHLHSSEKKVDLFGRPFPMAGSQDPSGRIINDLARENQSIPEATVIGWRYKASCSLAALVNGSAAHVLDYDDCSLSGCRAGAS